jgi:hypothetical protein
VRGLRELQTAITKDLAAFGREALEETREAFSKSDITLSLQGMLLGNR